MVSDLSYVIRIELIVVKGDEGDLTLTKEDLDRYFERLRDGKIMLPVVKEEEGKKPGYLVMPLHKGDEEKDKLAGRGLCEPGT